MNQTQINYVKTRAKAIYDAKRGEINERFKAPSISMTDKKRWLREGKFTIEDEQVREGYGLEGYINFTEAAAFDKDGKKEAEKALTASYNKLMDELVLGDNDQALELLRAFEAL